MVRFRFIDPGVIMGVVVSLIILAVGVFAFFSIASEIPVLLEESIEESKGVQGPIQNITDTGNSVFNIIGVVLIIGAIMAVVGLVYSVVRTPDYGPSSSSSSSKSKSLYSPLVYSNTDAFHKRSDPSHRSPPQTIGDYDLDGMYSVDSSLERAKEYRFNGHRVKIQNFSKNKKVKTTGDKICGVYVSKWRKEEEDIHGKPKFK